MLTCCRDDTLRTEASIFLTPEGNTIAAVTTLPRERGPAQVSPPDVWSTYASHRPELKLTEHWLLEVQRKSPYAISSQAISDAMVQAEKTLELMKRNETRPRALELAGA